MNDGREPPINTRPASKSLEVDFALYEHWLEDDDLTEDEKRDFLEALWSIIVSFVDLGWGVHPASEFCGKRQNGPDRIPAGGADMVGSEKNSQTPKTGHAVGHSLSQAERTRP